MAVKEDDKWYYSAPMSFLDNEINKPYNDFYGDPNYGANWANLTKTSSNSDQFAKEFSGALSQVSSLDDLLSEDCMRFLGVSERRLFMVYGALGDPAFQVNLKTKITTGEKNKYGHGYSLDSLTMETRGEDRWTRLDVNGGTLNSEDKYRKEVFTFSKYIQSDKFQLIAKDTNQGIKLSFFGSIANLFSNLDYDLGYEYFQEKSGDVRKIYEEGIDVNPFQRPYKKAILGFYGLGDKMRAETEREDYSDDSDSDYDYEDYDYDS